MAQLHKKFTDAQVKELFERYVYKEKVFRNISKRMG